MKNLVKALFLSLVLFSTSSYSAMTYEEYQEYLACVEEGSQDCGEYPKEIIVTPCASIDLDIGDLHIFDIYVVGKPMVPYAKLHWNGKAFEVIEIQKK